MRHCGGVFVGMNDWPALKVRLSDGVETLGPRLPWYWNDFLDRAASDEDEWFFDGEAWRHRLGRAYVMVDESACKKIRDLTQFEVEASSDFRHWLWCGAWYAAARERLERLNGVTRDTHIIVIDWEAQMWDALRQLEALR